jgi:hypothetical protein
MQAKVVPRFRRIRGPNCWGDFGDILIGGTGQREQGKEGRFLLERTGPFMPPISFTVQGCVIVTTNFRNKLSERFEELIYRPVTKKKVVEIHWEEWGRHWPPQEWPPGQYVSDYIHKGKHSPRAAKALGKLWEIVLPFDVKGAAHDLGQPGHYRYTVDLTTWNGERFFRLHPFDSQIVVTDEVARWLRGQVPEWVSFKQIAVG